MHLFLNRRRDGVCVSRKRAVFPSDGHCKRPQTGKRRKWRQQSWRPERRLAFVGVQTIFVAPNADGESQRRFTCKSHHFMQAIFKEGAFICIKRFHPEQSSTGLLINLLYFRRTEERRDWTKACVVYPCVMRGKTSTKRRARSLPTSARRRSPISKARCHLTENLGQINSSTNGISRSMKK